MSDRSSLNIQTRTPTRASTRHSMYSNAATIHSTESSCAEFQTIGETIDRLNDNSRRLADQRVELNEEKVVNLQKLALGAKLERALGRRMSSQDAVMRPRMRAQSTPKVLSEKDGEKMAAAA